MHGSSFVKFYVIIDCFFMIQLSGLRYSVLSNTKDRGTENDKMARNPLI